MAKHKKKPLVAWSCNGECKSNCCSELFFRLTPIQKFLLEKSGKFVEKTAFLDLEWLSFHKNIRVEKVSDDAVVIILLTKDYKILWNSIKKFHYVHITDKCINLLENNKCKIYLDRPQVCRITKCPVFSDEKEIEWFAENGLLKEHFKRYKKGELKKNV